MIKAAIDRILELGEIEKFEINQQSYTNKPIHEVKEPTVDPLQVHTLTGIVDYIEIGEVLGHYFLHVFSYDKVFLQSLIFGPFKQREKLIIAGLPEARQFSFGAWLDIEDFIIQVQAKFIIDETVEGILSLLSSIKDEKVKTSEDNGYSQTVTARSGIALVSQVEVPNPVTLRPYRTFLEIEQPASNYVFRLKSGDKAPMVSLHEAGGGLWKLEAIQGIKNFLAEALPGVPIIA
jgi:hypothetical protein